MIDLILVLALSFGGGWWFGGKNVTVTCQQEPLIIASCIIPSPPINNTFGATTDKLVETVGQFKSCRAACLPEHKLP